MTTATGAIEIYVGTKLVWKNGVLGPAYAQLQCYAEDREHPNVSDEGRLWTYSLRYEDGGLQPPQDPSCRVVWGAPQDYFSLSFGNVPSDGPASLGIATKGSGHDGWRLVLSGARGEDDKPIDVGFINPFIDGVPGGISSVSMRSVGVLDVYMRPLGDDPDIFGSGPEKLVSSIDISAYQIGRTYPDVFDTLGGNGPVSPEGGNGPVSPVEFWTNFRKCKEFA